MGRFTEAFEALARRPQRTTTPDVTKKQARPSPLIQKLHNRGTNPWQSQAWHDYRSVPEIKRAVNYHADSISRMRLYVGRPDPDGRTDPEEVDDPRLRAPLDALYGGTIMHARMLHRWTQLLKVAGEAYLVAYDHPDEWGNPQRLWTIASKDDLENKTGNIISIPFHTADDTVRHTIDVQRDSVMIIRDWIPDAQRLEDSDSPVRSLSDIATTLRSADAHVKATTESRLAGNGLLILDSDVTINATNTSTDLQADPEMMGLINAMQAPLQDRGVASAVVPVVMKYSGEKNVNQIAEHLTFATEYDSNVPGIMERAIRRIGVALDTPQEIVSGVDDTNHWNALFQGQDAVRVSFGPFVSARCLRLTESYLWPYLRLAGYPNPREFVIWWDASALVLPPDRSQIALDMYTTDPGLLSREAVREASGFAEADAGPAGTPLPSPENTTEANGARAAAAPTSGSDNVNTPSAPASPGRSAQTASQ